MSTRLSKKTALVMIALLVFAAGLTCKESTSSIEGGRPIAARLVLTNDAPGGSLGGGGDLSAYAFDGSYNDVVTSYEEWTLKHGGTASPGGFTSVQFDLGDACLVIHQWSERGENESMRIGARAEQVAELDGSIGSFVEFRPLDCNFRG